MDPASAVPTTHRKQRGIRSLLACGALVALCVLHADPSMGMTRIALDPIGLGHDNDAMGQAVALRGDEALIGAPGATPTPFVYSGAAEIFRRVEGNWSLEAILQPDDGATALGMGTAVALGEDVAVVAAPHADEDPPLIGNGGAFYTFARSGADWQQVDKVSFEHILSTPLALSLSGDTLVASTLQVARIFVRSGAGWAQQLDLSGDEPIEQVYGAAIDGDVVVMLSATEGGATFEYWAYFYARTGSQWTRQAKIDLGTSPDVGGGGPPTVAVSGDTAIIGMSLGFGTTSLVRAFVRTGDTWSLQGALDPGQDFIGPLSLALNGDTALIGCPGDSVLGHVEGGTAYAFSRSGGAWTRDAHIYDADVGDFAYKFGSSVALSDDIALVGSPGAHTDAGATGKTLVFAPGSWTFVSNLEEELSRQGERFGSSVAVAGSTLLVGAEGTARGDASSTGSAYVMEWSGTEWVQEAQLVPTADNTQAFGMAVALDGDTAVVSTSRDDVSGSAYVYARDATSWPLQARLVSGVADNAGFGWALALEGDTLVVGAPNSGNGLAGMAYLFDRTGSVWSAPTVLMPAESADDDRFGISIAMSGDTLIVGAPGADIGIEASAGAAYVFERSGSVWQETARLLAPLVTGGAGFGLAVAIQGDTAIVGAGQERGGAYVFSRTGGNWTWQATLVPDDLASLPASYGSAVAISADEQIALVGTPGGIPSAPDSGIAFAFTRDGNTWNAGAVLHGSSATGTNADSFGNALTFEGTEAFIGAPGDAGTGAVYVAGLGNMIFSDGFDAPP